MSEQKQPRSVFYEEWIKSLREQYKYVIRNNDRVTLPSLTQVMINDVGFSEAELAQLRVEATMHIDDVGVDYVPDMNILAGQPHPAECTCPQCIPIDESQFDDEGQPLINNDPEQETTETGHLFSVAKIESSTDPDDDETLTFADQLVDEAESIDEIDELESTEDDEEPKDDPNAPKQLSLF